MRGWNYPTSSSQRNSNEAVQPSILFKADLERLLASSDCVFQCLVYDEGCYKLPWIVHNKIKVSNVSLALAHIEDDAQRFLILKHLAPTLRKLKVSVVSMLDIFGYETIISATTTGEVSISEMIKNIRIG